MSSRNVPRRAKYAKYRKGTHLGFPPEQDYRQNGNYDVVYQDEIEYEAFVAIDHMEDYRCLIQYEDVSDGYRDDVGDT